MKRLFIHRILITVILLPFLLLYCAIGIKANPSVQTGKVWDKHIVILVDQTRNARSNRMYNALCELLTTGTTDLCLESSKIPEGSLKIDPNNDEISLFAFCVTTDDFKSLRPQSSPNLFSEVSNQLLHYRTSFSSSHKSLDEFCEEDIYQLFAKDDLSNKKLKLSLSQYAHQCVIRTIDNSIPAKRYIILTVSDFKSGLYDVRSSQDDKRLKEWFHSDELVDRFKRELNASLSGMCMVPYCNVDTKNGELEVGCNGKLVLADALIGTSAYISTAIKLRQRQFNGDIYDLSNVEITFPHNPDKVSVEEIIMEVWNGEEKQLNKTITNDPADISRFYQSSTQSYRLPRINDVKIVNIKNDKPLDIKFKILASTRNEQEVLLPFVFEAVQSINYENIDFRTKLSTTQMSVIVFLLFLLPSALVAFILILKGRPIGLEIKKNPFNDNYETIDFSTEGAGKTHTEYYAWQPEDDASGLTIKVKGRLRYQKPGQFFNWKEDTGYPVRITPEIISVPEGFSMYVAANHRVTNAVGYPIETDDFENKTFGFSIVVNKNNHKEIVNPIQFRIRLEVLCHCTGFLKKFFYTEPLDYTFHIGPELGDMWVGVDPGTTGSCIATATDTHDLTIEKDKRGKDLITPSTIVIKTVDLEDDSETSIRENTIYGQTADNQSSSSNYQKFVSIKKLLGYNEEFILKRSNGKTLSVKSPFLSTLLIEGLFDQHKKALEKMVTERPQFLNDGQYLPKRAVFAIPNNFTASKIKCLKRCISDSNLKSLKEVRFIYEAEAILVYYINSSHNPSGKKLQDSAQGENIFIFDMGGATINATLANIKHADNKYEINILAKLGYGIGGDTIDYAFLKWIYSKEKEFSGLSATNPFKSGDIALRQEKKKQVLGLKIQLIDHFGNDDYSQLLDRSDIESYFGAKAIVDAEGSIENDPFVKDIQSRGRNFLSGPDFERYVWSNIRSITNDILTVCEQKGVTSLNTIIFSGRSSHFPKVADTVIKIAKKSHEISPVHLDLEESKTAVAKGACYYGVQNNRILLYNRSVNGVFGVIQTLDSPTAEPTFHKLIEDGRRFDSSGVATGYTPITKDQDFTWDGQKARFCQVMGVNPEEVIAKKEKHKYTEIAVIPAKPFAIKGVQITVTEKDKIICSVTDVNDNVLRPIEGQVNDSDIIACNDEQYTFFIKQA